MAYFDLAEEYDELKKISFFSYLAGAFWSPFLFIQSILYGFGYIAAKGFTGIFAPKWASDHFDYVVTNSRFVNFLTFLFSPVLAIVLSLVYQVFSGVLFKTAVMHFTYTNDAEDIVENAEEREEDTSAAQLEDQSQPTTTNTPAPSSSPSEKPNIKDLINTLKPKAVEIVKLSQGIFIQTRLLSLTTDLNNDVPGLGFTLASNINQKDIDYLKNELSSICSQFIKDEYAQTNDPHLQDVIVHIKHDSIYIIPITVKTTDAILRHLPRLIAGISKLNSTATVAVASSAPAAMFTKSLVDAARSAGQQVGAPQSTIGGMANK